MCFLKLSLLKSPHSHSESCSNSAAQLSFWDYQEHLFLLPGLCVFLFLIYSLAILSKGSSYLLLHHKPPQNSPACHSVLSPPFGGLMGLAAGELGCCSHPRPRLFCTVDTALAAGAAGVNQSACAWPLHVAWAFHSMAAAFCEGAPQE